MPYMDAMGYITMCQNDPPLLLEGRCLRGELLNFRWVLKYFVFRGLKSHASQIPTRSPAVWCLLL